MPVSILRGRLNRDFDQLHVIGGEGYPELKLELDTEEAKGWRKEEIPRRLDMLTETAKEQDGKEERQRGLKPVKTRGLQPRQAVRMSQFFGLPVEESGHPKRHPGERE